MKTTPRFFSVRAWTSLLAAGAALLSASGASAQTTTPFYAFVVSNLTESNGSLAYPVYDSVTFASTQVNEVFADGFTTAFAIGDAQNSVQAMDTQASALMTSASGNGGFSDPVHGLLTSATLTGTLAFPGFFPTNTLSMSVLTDAAGDQAQQTVFAPFSASLFGAAPVGIPVGTFSLMNLGSTQGTTVNIDAVPVPAAVPEASSSISLGLLMLGLGGVAVARRKRTGSTSH